VDLFIVKLGNYLFTSVQGGACGHGLCFVDKFVKRYVGWWADTTAALLPNGDTGISNFIVNKG